MYDVHVIETSGLGDRSYLVTDGTAAAVVDPQRDVDRVLALAGELGVRITAVAETHLHNDYVSGGLELARLTGAVYGMAHGEEVAFDRLPIEDGDVLEVSPALRLRALHTPGHTFHHLSYVLEHEGTPVGVFTGGSLLFGTTGRPDLLGHEHAETLARHQHASARRLADTLPGGAAVWPTHGFGSFCAIGATSGGAASTLAGEKLANPALRLAEDAFVAGVLAGLDAYPAYYAHMGAVNAAGPAPVDLRLPTPADPAELARRLDAGEWVVDLRSRTAYAASHVTGSVSLGLDGSMATWLGWLTERGAPITLLGATRDEVSLAHRELVRIGVDQSAVAVGAPEELAPDRLSSLRRATFADLAKALAGPGAPVVLDVRLGGEWRDGHVDGSINIPLPELTRRAAEIPPGEVWVHCGTGYRATAAASLLARAGRTAVVVDDAFATAADQGVPMAA
ncbi:rhodanese-like domain-containing protein [Nonomuraea typhae]|uniref:Rhodanese-like domain-containing protein n=1 Tax=Nonomuraea typhae TaxID=2603600 RepID=A0ABW7YTS8_9ACTN